MEPTLFRFILRYSWRQQLLLLLMTAASFPFLYASLDLPKTIVNHAIGNYERQSILGIDLQQVEYLMLLAGAFLALVIINGGFKYFINVYKGQLGERMLRRLRYQMYASVLRFPVGHFRKTSQGELIAMITAEAEPIGGFVGDAVALPAFEGRTLLTILVFMYIQDWVLGLAATALYPLQMYIIPKLQRQVNALAKQRVRTVRRLSERVGESVAMIEDVHVNDTAERERAQFTRLVGTIYEIRYRIYRKKFFMKFLNSFMGQLTPFFFYAIGGYLVIRGGLSFGALVAVLAAYKDLSDPWKELLSWYQQKEDSRVKYEQLVEQFQPPGLLAEELQAPPTAPVAPLAGELVAANLVLQDDLGIRTVDGASFRFPVDARVALLGGAGSGRSAVARILARLEWPSAGTVHVGGEDLLGMPQHRSGRRLAYVGAQASMLNASLADNLLYAVRNWPVGESAAGAAAATPAGAAADAAFPADPRGQPDPADPVIAREKERRRAEALQAGNTPSDPEAAWIDFAALGIAGPAGLEARLIDVLQLVDLSTDVFGFGLRRTIDPDERQELAARILDARRCVRDRLSQPPYLGLVEPFDRTRYNNNMSVAENLLFGLPRGPGFDLDRLDEHPFVQGVLEKAGLREEFYRVGVTVAKLMLELFQDLDPGDPLFERFSFISAADVPQYQAAIRRVEMAGAEADAERADPSDRSLFGSLPFKLVPARHRLGVFDDDIAARILHARDLFAAELPAGLRGAIAFFAEDAYNPAASVQDNILFGKIVYGRQQAPQQVGELIASVIEQEGLKREVVLLGLEFEVGVAGGLLSTQQRQKLALARALLKRPDLLIVDQATASLDPAAQALLLSKLLRAPDVRGVVWVTSGNDEAALFGRVIRMDGGRVVGEGLDAVAV